MSLKTCPLGDSANQDDVLAIKLSRICSMKKAGMLAVPAS